MCLAGCRNNINTLQIFNGMEHGAWGLNCRENNICANNNIVLNFRISRVLALSNYCSMLYAPCSMPKLENIIKLAPK